MGQLFVAMSKFVPGTWDLVACMWTWSHSNAARSELDTDPSSTARKQVYIDSVRSTCPLHFSQNCTVRLCILSRVYNLQCIFLDDWHLCDYRTYCRASRVGEAWPLEIFNTRSHLALLASRCYPTFPHQRRSNLSYNF